MKLRSWYELRELVAALETEFSFRNREITLRYVDAKKLHIRHGGSLKHLRG